jgi:hypothetical protein
MMKKLLAMGSLLLSLSSYSQSYIILGNGVTLTTDQSGFVYDFGNFILPYKVSLTGGQFLAEEGQLISIDSSGILYRKDEKAPSKLRGKGNNYFISEKGSLYTIDQSGFIYRYEKESSFKKNVGFGGNFFTVKSEDKKDLIDLYTVNSKGNYFKMNVPELDNSSIKTMGGMFFQTSKGAIYTVSQDGQVFSKESFKTGMIKKSGGNYFIDSSDIIYTVSAEGFLYTPALPSYLKIDSVTKLGQNYFLYQEGRLYTVDSQGIINERIIKSHDLKDVKILSL